MICFLNSLSHPPLTLGTATTRRRRTHSFSHVSVVTASVLCSSAGQKLEHHHLSRIVCRSLKYKRCGPVCLFGEKENSRGEKKGFSWDSLKDFMTGWRKEKTVQDMLNEQMRQREFGGDGGNRNPPGTGGDGSGEPEDEGLAGILDETLQVILATLGFIFVYIYMIQGAELTKLARDYIKYLLGGIPSMRLKRVMDKWRESHDKVLPTEYSDDWLERRIVDTPTWWNRPEELVRDAESSTSDDDEDES
ncbi:hypothetical protein AXF42_Ash011170 [Apostasia shenzhenica]|uniref:Uncharacterized protein n=1 Tax=Apostasia shenzhenica TaxID=1088818 RepID=A0A2I0AL16_9ASPA|nr:hypothetical protein AXF42_Ash011170 [Apostasia shenzhenica]